ncbi:hypothetical protein [Kribbella aluminosa]|uniref:hypothetical protein n=1 Tax=Kribbella aluminosa TaxID=416017 RepID=UPI001AE200D2|nr:hypothetical protein [Kribbella aluminosa]
MTPAVNRWIGSLFDPMHRSETIETLLVEDDAEDHRIEHVEDLRGRVRAAKITMDRVRKALDAGWDPVELREQYNAAAAEKQTAERLLASLPTQATITRAQLEEWIDELGDIGAALNVANPEELNQLYGSLRLSLKYHHADQTVDVEVDPMGDRVDKVCVRGGT